MMNLIRSALGVLFGGSGVGSAIANVSKVAALAPAAYWLLENKDGIAVCFSYGELAVVGMVIFAVLQAAHYARGPGY
jgi:hypothetical protein